MKYPKKNEMPKNVYHALRLTAKMGFLSRHLWNTFFNSGKTRWTQKQIKALTENDKGLLKKHSNPTASNYFILTPKAQGLLLKENVHIVRPTPVAQLAHDEFIAESLFRLEKSGLIKSWITENEMKSSQMRRFELSTDPRNMKYPDVVFELSAQNKTYTIALEYERTRKASSRYKDILWLYSNMSNVSMILFVCEDQPIINEIKNKLKLMRLPNLFGKVAFAFSSNWKLNPAETSIELDGKAFTLKELCLQKRM